MAAIFTAVDGADGLSGTVRERYFDITFDAAYATGGVPIDPDSAGMVVIFGIKFIGQATVAGTLKTTTFFADYDFKNLRLQFFGSNGAAPAALAEMANATALATFVVRAVVVGV